MSESLTAQVDSLMPERVEVKNDILGAVMEATVGEGKREHTISVPIPENLNEMTAVQRAIILQSTPLWSGYSLLFIMFVDKWAQQRGLDIFGGNVYIVDGKPNTTDEAKISYAMRSGKVEYMNFDDVVKGTNPMTGANDFYVMAHLKLVNEPAERTYKAWLSEWKNDKNLNWKKNPTDSLQRKALARISHFAVPMGAEADDFIPAPVDSNGRPLVGAVESELTKVSAA